MTKYCLLFRYSSPFAYCCIVYSDILYVGVTVYQRGTLGDRWSPGGCSLECGRPGAGPCSEPSVLPAPHPLSWAWRPPHKSWDQSGSWLPQSEHLWTREYFNMWWVGRQCQALIIITTVPLFFNTPVISNWLYFIETYQLWPAGQHSPQGWRHSSLPLVRCTCKQPLLSLWPSGPGPPTQPPPHAQSTDMPKENRSSYTKYQTSKALYPWWHVLYF